MFCMEIQPVHTVSVTKSISTVREPVPLANRSLLNLDVHRESLIIENRSARHAQAGRPRSRPTLQRDVRACLDRLVTSGPLSRCLAESWLGPEYKNQSPPQGKK